MPLKLMPLCVVGALALAAGPLAHADPVTAPATARASLPGMPPLVDANNLYSETAAGKFAAATKDVPPRVYVPEHGGDSVTVIDQATLTVVAHFHTGPSPQHVVPSWDLKTLWVTNNNDFHRRGGSGLTRIDPMTGKAGTTIEVSDPYNMYFMPDGSAAIVVNEAQRRLDFRDPQTMALLYAIPTPECYGLNHADFSMDGTYALFSCEFGGAVAKIDLVNRKVLGTLKLLKPMAGMTMPDMGGEQASTSGQAGRRVFHGGSRRGRRHGGMRHMMMGHGMPQDIRISPDGKIFYVADMVSDGVFLVDGEALTQVGFLPTGPGAHGFCVSRDAKKLYVSNRGSHAMPSGRPHNPGSVSVIDFATRKVEANWPIPGGGSPDMGGVSADGKTLWFAGRFDNEVYAIDTTTGSVTKIKVGSEPHGLAVWPQPGRYSLGHTGNMR